MLGTVIRASAFEFALGQGTLLKDAPLPGDDDDLERLSYAFLAEKVFPHRKNVLYPNPGHNEGDARDKN